MRKNFLRNLNLLLGAISLTLAGCHTQKKVAPNPENDPANSNQPIVEQPQIQPQPEQDDVPVCLYGPPPESYATPKPEPYEMPARKYGVPTPPEKE